MTKTTLPRSIAVFLILLVIAGINSNAQDVKEITQGLTGVNSGGADLADYNGDGAPDILITGKNDQDEPVTMIYTNNGDGSFTPLSNSGLPDTWLGDAAWGDYNNNGRPDVLITGATKANTPYAPITKLYRNNGNGTFTEVQGSNFAGVFGSSIAWADIDKNGKLDFLLTGKTARGQAITRIYQNIGGKFVEIKSQQLPGVWMGDGDLGDYNKDGNVDILLTGQNANGKAFSAVFTNEGNLKFRMNPEISLLPMDYSSASFKDYNRDGYPDITLLGKNVGNVPSTKLYLNDGNGGFAEHSGINLTGLMAGSISWGDYDGNGYDDLLVSGRNSGNQSVAKLYRNFGGNSFGVARDIELTGVRYSNSSIYIPGGSREWTILLTGQTNTGNNATIVYQAVTSKEVAFSVKNSETGSPVTGAKIKINDENLQTGRQGKTKISLKKGDYNYTVNANGFVSAKGKVKVENSTVNRSIELKPIKQIILTLRNAKTQNPVKGARVKIGNSIITTGDDGIARLDTFSGNYQCNIIASGYKIAKTKLSLNEGNMEKEIGLEPYYNVQFSLKDAKNKTAISNGTIHVGSHKIRTGNKGKAAFDTLSGTYNYKVQAKGYLATKGEIEVKNSDAVKFVKLTPTYPITMNFINADTQEQLSRIRVNFGGKTYATNQKGYVKIDTTSGSYPVEVDAFSFVTINDTLTLKNKGIKKTYEVKPTYKAVFLVHKGRDGNPVDGAVIEVGNRTIKTNASGMAVMDTTSGEYRYTIIIRGEEFTTKSFTIDGSSVRLKFIAN